VQHAVVGADVDHGRSARVARLEGAVLVVGIVPRRSLHIDRFGTDDVAEQVRALAVVAAEVVFRTFVALVTANEVEQWFALGLFLRCDGQTDRTDLTEL
jgi:hypothetical protein